MIKIKEISINDIISNDKIKYNTSNLWINNIKPNDYDEIISNVQTNKWIHNFRNYKKIIIDNKKDLYWMKKAFEIGSKTKRFPNMYDDELEDIINRYKFTDIFDGTKYFVRSEDVSLKEGINGIGPYTNFKSIIESMVTCRYGHSPINNNSSIIILYLCPFLENIDKMKEFRIFVCKNKITAISQQAIYNSNYILNKLNDHDKNNLINKWINIIIEYFENEIKKKIIHIDSYVVDFAILNDDKPYFIEINSFGKEYTSGSALFNWIEDYDILYGLTDYIEFRYTI